MLDAVSQLFQSAQMGSPDLFIELCKLLRSENILISYAATVIGTTLLLLPTMLALALANRFWPHRVATATGFMFGLSTLQLGLWMTRHATFDSLRSATLGVSGYLFLIFH